MSREPKDYTAEEVAETLSWHPTGFTAATCTCGKTVNVLMGPGWFCSCGEFNPLPWVGPHMLLPFDNPDHGPSAETIREGAKSRGVRV